MPIIFGFPKLSWILAVTSKGKPKQSFNSHQIFSICHWNLNSIYAHNYKKISLLRAYISTHNFEVICISETYLDSDISDDDKNLKIADYNLM